MINIQILRRNFGLLILLVLSTLPLTAAQEIEETPPVITAGNVTQLQSTIQIDFANYDDLNIASGWFILSSDGEYSAVVHHGGGLAVFNLDGEVVSRSGMAIDENEFATVLDAAFGHDDHTMAVLLHGRDEYFIHISQIDGELNSIRLPRTRDMPVRIWLDETGDYVWLEALAQNANHYVQRIPLDGEGETLTLPSGPENDETAYVRIGRIPAPLAITATQDGLVKRWNLETGEVTAEVELNAIPVFGRIDETNGSHLAWRDPASENLYLLNFETGENRLIAPLDGQYVQAFVVTPSADVILAVGIEDDPRIIAWDAATGEKYEIGEYRQCVRVPDMVRLSTDGTTLVIGCDTGLDIWRVVGSD